MDEKLIESLKKDKFSGFSNTLRKRIECEDKAKTYISYWLNEETFHLSFVDYGTTESDFSAMFETIIEESIRNLGEEETKKIITKLVKEWLE